MTPTQTDPVAPTTPDVLAEQIARLREIFPEAFTEGKVDFDKLRAALGEQVDYCVVTSAGELGTPLRLPPCLRHRGRAGRAAGSAFARDKERRKRLSA